MYKCALGVRPPACPVSETLAFPGKFAGHTTRGGEKEQSLPLAYSGARWPLAASSCFPWLLCNSSGHSTWDYICWLKYISALEARCGP